MQSVKNFLVYVFGVFNFSWWITLLGELNITLGELNIDIMDNGNLDRNHRNGILLYAKNLIDGIRKLWCKEKISKECLSYNFQIPRKYICHDDFNIILTNFNGQGENIVNNSRFIDTNVNSPKNNLNKTHRGIRDNRDNAQR